MGIDFAKLLGVPSLDTEDILLRSAENRVRTFNDTTGQDDGTGINCPACKNKGLIAFLDTESNNFSVRECKCHGARLTVHRLQKCGVWERAKKCRLENFRTDTAAQKAMKRHTERFIENPSGHWLCFCGQSGTGKTFLTTVAFTALSYKFGAAGQYLQWNQDSRALKAAILEDPDGLWVSFKSTPLLLIDDVFKGAAPSPADLKMIFEILDFRYNNDLTTLISTEYTYTFDQLLDADQAIASRIKEKCGEFLISIAPDVGKNYRLN